jgi:hypothetical protein
MRNTWISSSTTSSLLTTMRVRNDLLFVLLLLLSVWTTTTILAQETETGNDSGTSGSTNTPTAGGPLQDLYSCDDPNDPTNLISCNVDTSLWDLDALQPDQSPDTSQVCIELIQILVDAQSQEQDQDTNDGDDNNGLTTFNEILSSVVVDALEPCVLWAMEYGDLRQEDDEDDSSNNEDNNSQNQPSNQQVDQVDEETDEGKS